jgi:N-acetylneuraminic acid mutarotase
MARLPMVRNAFVVRALPTLLLGVGTPLLPSAASAAQVELVRVNGQLGALVQYFVSADPGQLYVLMPSFQTGPLPLALLDPGDPRVLGIGLDLQSAWAFAPLDVFGNGAVSYPLPNSAALQGLPLYAQAITLPGVATLVDDISPRNGFALCFNNTTALTVGDLPVAIAGHTATALDDGRVLIAGGGATDAQGAAVPGDRLYLFDPQTQEFSTSSATLITARAAHTATLLADGRVLLLGGSDDNSLPLASAELYDPSSDSVSAAAPMPGPRVAHTATRLGDGRVFVACGANGFDLADPLAGLGNILSSTLVYNPANNTWSSGPSFPRPRVGHAASLLADGRVLLTGGLEVTQIIFIGPVPSITADARYYQPSNNTLQDAPDFSGARALHTQTTLPDGRVLVAGGATLDILSLSITTFDTVRLFASGGWSNVASLAQPRVYAQSVVTSGGGLVVVGGLQAVDTTGGSANPATAIEASSGAFGSWTSTATLSQPRVIPTATAIDGGQRVLVVGGVELDLTAETYLP